MTGGLAGDWTWRTHYGQPPERMSELEATRSVLFLLASQIEEALDDAGDEARDEDGESTVWAAALRVHAKDALDWLEGHGPPHLPKPPGRLESWEGARA